MKMLLVNLGLMPVLGLGAFFLGRKPEEPKPFVEYSRMGRDMALIKAIRGAKRTILVRSSCFQITPIANELLQAAQNGVQIRVELPMVSTKEKDANLLQALVGSSDRVTFLLGAEPEEAYAGTYLLVDETEVIYSASALSMAWPGVPRAYVKGRINHGVS